MARVIGIGGLFWRARDAAATKAWYAKHLGIAASESGAMFPWRDPQTGAEHLTIWSIFPQHTQYFGDPDKQFMMNFIVDDLDGMVQELAAAGVTVDPKREDHRVRTLRLDHRPRRQSRGTLATPRRINSEARS